MITLFGLTAIVWVRMHYSLDVVLALYFTVTVWSSYHRIANDVNIGHRFSAVWIVDALIVYPAIEWIERPEEYEEDADEECVYSPSTLSSDETVLVPGSEVETARSSRSRKRRSPKNQFSVPELSLEPFSERTTRKRSRSRRKSPKKSARKSLSPSPRYSLRSSRRSL